MFREFVYLCNLFPDILKACLLTFTDRHGLRPSGGRQACDAWRSLHSKSVITSKGHGSTRCEGCPATSSVQWCSGVSAGDHCKGIERCLCSCYHWVTNVDVLRERERERERERARERERESIDTSYLRQHCQSKKKAEDKQFEKVPPLPLPLPPAKTKPRIVSMVPVKNWRMRNATTKIRVDSHVVSWTLRSMRRPTQPRRRSRSTRCAPHSALQFWSWTSHKQAVMRGRVVWLLSSGSILVMIEEQFPSKFSSSNKLLEGKAPRSWSEPRDLAIVISSGWYRSTGTHAFEITSYHWRHTSSTRFSRSCNAHAFTRTRIWCAVLC